MDRIVIAWQKVIDSRLNWHTRFREIFRFANAFGGSVVFNLVNNPKQCLLEWQTFRNANTTSKCQHLEGRYRSNTWWWWSGKKERAGLEEKTEFGYIAKWWCRRRWCIYMQTMLCSNNMHFHINFKVHWFDEKSKVYLPFLPLFWAIT